MKFFHLVLILILSSLFLAEVSFSQSQQTQHNLRHQLGSGYHYDTPRPCESEYQALVAACHAFATAATAWASSCGSSFDESSQQCQNLLEVLTPLSNACGTAGSAWVDCVNANGI